MLYICATCQAVIKIDMIDYKKGPSHGMCLHCAVDFMRLGGLSEEHIKEFIKKHKEEDLL